MTWELRNILKEKGAIVDENPDTDVCYLYDTEVAKVVVDELAAKEENLTVFLNTLITDVIQEGNTVVGLKVISEMQAETCRSPRVGHRHPF